MHFDSLFRASLGCTKAPSYVEQANNNGLWISEETNQFEPRSLEVPNDMSALRL